MKAINTRCFATAIVMITAAAFTVPVLAAPTGMTTKISVSSHDIDLSSPDGVQRLRDRVDSTIRTACAPTEFGGAIDHGTREQARALDACRADAHAVADPQLRRRIAAGNPKIASN